MLYICDIFFIFGHILIVIDNVIIIDALVFCIFFRKFSTIFSLKKVIDFQKEKAQPQGVA